MGDSKGYLKLIASTGSMAATAKHVSGRCMKAASNLDRAKDWFHDCLRNHHHDRDEAATRPSRLIAIGTADSSEPIKIVDGSDADKKYLAVSYRWGAETLLTVSETFELFHVSIPWKQLPQTFQDAIHIARELGIRYIWIDSLCIIQDNLADWEIESAKMADIYKGALLTIMAASASDSQGGFFGDDVILKGFVALPYTDANGATEFSVFVREALPSFHNPQTAFPLFQRGWVFQERLLSKRKLIFGPDKKYWECGGVVLSESNIESRSRYERDRSEINAAFQIFSEPSSKVADMNDPTSPGVLWKNLVAGYSKCALTYQADRLPALSGLARTFAQRFGGTYAAGLWQDQIPCSLAWFFRPGIPRETDKREYCAPSWSWASINGSVEFRDHGKNELEVVSVDIELAGRDLYGKVCPDSSICVRGRLRRGKLVERGYDGYEGQLETEHGCLKNRGYLDRDDENLPLEVYFLEISSGSGYLDVKCLLLHKTESGNQFRRVGMADLHETDFFYGLQKEVITIV